MIIGFEGTLGAGKTLGATIFTWYHALAGTTNVASNLPLRPEAFAKHEATIPDFWLGYLDDQEGFVEVARRGGGVICWDEMHLSFDNRSWARKTQTLFTQFMMYLRKINTPVFFTSQSIRHQLDVRIRNVMDLACVCSKDRASFRYEFFDAVSGRLLRRYRIPKILASKFYGVYDTRRIVRPIHFPETEREYLLFLDKLSAAVASTNQRREMPLDDFFKVLPGGLESVHRAAVPVYVPFR